MSVWFTADLHLGHRRVSELRGFTDVIDHDTTLEQNWRATVRDGDHVWVLGDVAVSSPKTALARISYLPGVKHLISGNHDGCHPMHRDAYRRAAAYLEVFASVQSAARRRFDGVEVLLSHFPYDADRGETRHPQWRFPNRGAWLLHGHTHQLEKWTSAREIHVGVDAWDLRPVSDGEIARMIGGTE